MGTLKTLGAVPKTKLDKVTKNPSAYGQDAVKPVQNLWASSQPLETYSRSGQTKSFGDHQDLPSREWVTSVDFKDAYFHIPLQEQSRRFHIQGQVYQFKVSATRLVGELREMRAGAQTRLQFFRLSVRLQVWSGPTDSGPVAEPSTENTETAIPTGLPGPGIHALDRFTDSYRKASSSRPTSYKTHAAASVESTRITKKGNPNPQVPAPPFTMVAEGTQYTYRPTITPNITCSANIYRRIKRRVGRSLRQAHCKRNLVPSGRQAAYKLSRTKSSLSGFKRVPRPLLKQDSTCSN